MDATREANIKALFELGSMGGPGAFLASSDVRFAGPNDLFARGEQRVSMLVKYLPRCGALLVRKSPLSF